ncbi:hypothetical protein SUGI_0868740 [Cryptomeria japonica]|nr:hypothetical protein SUGI_0868740 [Cryptomeria japonica]
MGFKVLSGTQGAVCSGQGSNAVLSFPSNTNCRMGFFTDAYDLFCIPPVSNLLGRLYYDNAFLPSFKNSAVNAVAPCGAFAGQLFFGWLGDRMGRKKVYGITLTLIVASSILSGFSLGSTRKSVLTCLCFFRFWLGFGIGGDYPPSATIMAEYTNTKTRGSFIAFVFAMQGLGFLAASVVAIIVSAPLNRSFLPISGVAGHGVEDYIDARGCSRRVDILLANENAGDCPLHGDGDQKRQASGR